MAIGIGIGISYRQRRRGGVPAFSPAALFANGEDGDEFAFERDFCFTLNGGGVYEPVTTTGDEIARVAGRHNSQNVDQEILAQRPIYNEGGGLSWAYFDGVDDNMVSTLQLGNRAELSVFFGYRSNVISSGNGYIFTAAGSEGGRGNQGASFLSASGSNEIYTLGGSSNDLPRILNSDRVFASSGSKTTGALTFGFEGNQQAGSAGAVSTADGLLIGAREGGVNFEGRIYNMIFRAALTDANLIAQVEAYTASKAGVEL